MCLKYKNKEKPKTGPRPGPLLNFDVKIGLKPSPRDVKKVGACRARAEMQGSSVKVNVMEELLRLLRVPKTVLLCLLMSFVRLKILLIYRQFKRNSLQNTSMTAEALWISAMHTNTNSRRRLLRSYKAFVYC